jgi:hypothetical protein
MKSTPLPDIPIYVGDREIHFTPARGRTKVTKAMIDSLGADQVATSIFGAVRIFVFDNEARWQGFCDGLKATLDGDDSGFFHARVAPGLWAAGIFWDEADEAEVSWHDLRGRSKLRDPE